RSNRAFSSVPLPLAWFEAMVIDRYSTPRRIYVAKTSLHVMGALGEPRSTSLSLLACDNWNISYFQPRRWCDQKRRVKRHQPAASRRGHVVAIDPPRRVEPLHERLEFRFLRLAPAVLLKRRLIDEAIPPVGDERAVDEPGCQRPARRARLDPRACLR